MDSGGGVSLDSHLIVVGRELMEQLFNAIFLSWAVHIGHLVLRQGAVVLMNLSKRQKMRVMKNILATWQVAHKPQLY